MSSEFIFNDHSELKGRHALFSPSQSSWLRYDDEQIVERISNQYRTRLGTEIHEFAATQIELKHKISNIRNLIHEIENYIYVKYQFLSPDGEISDGATKLVRNVSHMPNEVFETVKCYINDGIGYRMKVEQPLIYSENVFGTADSIIFRKKDNLLRIHDLKTGSTPAHMEQLETYAALFCLEYHIKPSDILYELRLYQLNNVLIHTPTVEDILPIMDKIITTEKIASKTREV